MLKKFKGLLKKMKDDYERKLETKRIEKERFQAEFNDFKARFDWDAVCEGYSDYISKPVYLRVDYKLLYEDIKRDQEL